MGSDDICNTGLVLGLGFTSTIETSLNTDNQRPKKLCPNFEPSLTLGLLAGEADLLYLQDSVGASSFSNASVKRERAEEIEAERVSSRMSTDEDDDCINGRTKKLRLSKDQSALLEQSFNHHSTLNPKQKQDLARELKLRPRQVEVWFQNRRARTKLKQTEVDCDFLKKFCETLKDENRRLQKELHELKQLRVAQPLYMQLPGTTLTMCPSCERISSVGADKTSKNHPFKMAPKPHFYNPFTNPSAAC